MKEKTNNFLWSVYKIINFRLQILQIYITNLVRAIKHYVIIKSSSSSSNHHTFKLRWYFRCLVRSLVCLFLLSILFYREYLRGNCSSWIWNSKNITSRCFGGYLYGFHYRKNCRREELYVPTKKCAYSFHEELSYNQLIDILHLLNFHEQNNWLLWKLSQQMVYLHSALFTIRLYVNKFKRFNQTKLANVLAI